ncbi:MAG: AgmX/PglI C-terminal domain-containing protein, partial [Pseudomonadales bacterium]
EREELEEIPPQLAKIILEKKQLPPPPPPPEVKKEKPVEKKKPKPKPKPKVKPKPKPKPVQTVEEARDKAALSGLLQFKDDLQEMRESVDKEKLSNNELSRAAGEARKIERSIITGKAGGTSGGINTSNLSRNTGGAALSGRETTKVSGPVANLGKGDGSGVGGSGSGISGRSDESVRKVFDRNKGSIFAIYNRALRKDPALQGKVTIKLVIEPSGAVSSVKLVSSELNKPALESKLIARIKLINFGAEKVKRTTVNYSFDFLPF